MLPSTMTLLPNQFLRSGIPRTIPSKAAARMDQTKIAGGFGKSQKAAMPKTPLMLAKNKAEQASTFQILCLPKFRKDAGLIPRDLAHSVEHIIFPIIPYHAG